MRLDLVYKSSTKLLHMTMLFKLINKGQAVRSILPGTKRMENWQFACYGMKLCVLLGLDSAVGMQKCDQ